MFSCFGLWWEEAVWTLMFPQCCRGKKEVQQTKRVNKKSAIYNVRLWDCEPTILSCRFIVMKTGQLWFLSLSRKIQQLSTAAISRRRRRDDSHDTTPAGWSHFTLISPSSHLQRCWRRSEGAVRLRLSGNQRRGWGRRHAATTAPLQQVAAACGCWKSGDGTKVRAEGAEQSEFSKWSQLWRSQNWRQAPRIQDGGPFFLTKSLTLCKGQRSFWLAY